MMFTSVITNVTLVLSAGFIIYKAFIAFWKYRITIHVINKIPGPPTIPIFGNARFTPAPIPDRYRLFTGITQLYGKHGVCRLWFGPVAMIIISSPEAVEKIVSSNTELQKGYFYDTIKPWLGEGLLTTSNVKLWFHHRKLLTPAFHFNILEDFLVVMNEQTDVLLNKLSSVLSGKTFDIYPYIKTCTLDIICESAMGTPINAQHNYNSEYASAVYEFGKTFTIRNQRFWLRSDVLFKFTKFYKIQEHCLKIMKGFTRRIIQEKKEAMLNEQKNDIAIPKKRLAFLDLILSTKKEDGQSAFTDDQIQEQVDTFMFAGHDTTTQGICWFLYMIGHHPHIQEKCYSELLEIFGDSDRHVTFSDIRQMKYLECCIKESQRLYPSAPAFGRTFTKDMNLCNYDIPSGTPCFISLYNLHRNPDVWSDPEKFDPERFRTENISRRHPYAFIPFSAGPRNCIGQKFAMLEEKVILSRILRSFKIKTVDSRDEINMAIVFVLQNLQGFKVQLIKR